MNRRTEGRIFKRIAKDGTVSWRLGWELPAKIDPETGVAKRQHAYKTIHVKTKREAEIELEKVLRTLRDGTYVAPNELRLGELCEDWLKSRLDLRKLRANTLNGYAMQLRKYVIPRIGSLRVQKLTTDTFQTLCGDLLREGSTRRMVRAPGEDVGTPRPLSARTVVHIHRTCRQVIAWAKRQRRIAFDPTEDVELPKIEDDHHGEGEGSGGSAIVTALTEEQLATLLAAFTGHSMDMLVRLAARTGMRRGELLALRWCDVDWAKTVLRVEWTLVDGGKAADGKLTMARPKTKRSRRAVALGAGTLSELDAFWKAQAADALKLGRQLKRHSEDLIFPHSIVEPRRPRQPRAVTKEFARKAAGLGFSEFRFHDLRHTHATLLLKNGANLKVVSERLGHATATITLNIYQHVLPGMQESAAAMFDELLEVARA
jgi:integrase